MQALQENIYLPKAANWSTISLIAMSYGKLLKAGRKEKKMSQGSLAAQITARGHRTTVGTVSNVEREYYVNQDGTPTKPHRKFVVLAAEILEMDVDEALLAAGYAPTSFAPGQPQTLAEFLERLEALGISNIHFHEHEHSTPDELQEALDAVSVAIDVTLRRQQRNKSD